MNGSALFATDDAHSEIKTARLSFSIRFLRIQHIVYHQISINKQKYDFFHIRHVFSLEL